jgi:hypothetical protein
MTQTRVTLGLPVRMGARGVARKHHLSCSRRTAYVFLGQNRRRQGLFFRGEVTNQGIFFSCVAIIESRQLCSM